ncbi:MAG: GAF domain-containing protein [Pirellulales bacterium]|nr:GAF domain-containing protein [Pirellulales bacterium]
MHHLPVDLPQEKPALYRLLETQYRALTADEPDFLANAANLTSLLYHSLPDVNWAGFYFLKETDLVLGPFQGKPACTRIALGKGVCGTAAARRQTLIVPDVRQFPGHIACDPATHSEIVVPLIKNEKLLGVLDLDSEKIGRFNEEDQQGLEITTRVLLSTRFQD